MASPRTPTSASSRRSRMGDAAVGQFVLDGEIGKGSFAQVFRGTHKETGAAVAIKCVELARLNKKLKENLQGEIKILKTLRHPHIVALHACFESDTHINLVMEYCELGDLSMLIKKREKLITHPATHDMARKYPNSPNSGLNEVVIRHFLKQLSSALKFLREGNFVHRDVKPQNLLLLPSPHYREANKDVRPVLTASNDSLIPVSGLSSLPMLKLADFGFARVLPSTSLAETLCGSPLYMAPEILRYERYDAKADLWSVGTVLYEMVSGRPPFRASNHVELLRKIESSDDVIKFPKEAIVSAEMKALIRSLLRRSSVERISFENFFNHEIVTSPIPGLVEDDVPKPERRVSRDIRMVTRPVSTIERRISTRSTRNEDSTREQRSPRSPVVPGSSPKTSPGEGRQLVRTGEARFASRNEGEGLGIRRPQGPQPSSSAPDGPSLRYDDRRRRDSTASISTRTREQAIPSSPLANESAKGRMKALPENRVSSRAAAAQQDVADEREYVLIEKKQVEVNAFADELAANPPGQQPRMGRRYTSQGQPTSTTGAVPAPTSQAMQIAQGNKHVRQQSLDGRAASTSPGSTASFISGAIHAASLRLFGIKYTPQLLKNASPPQLYTPFPAYPTPVQPAGLLTDGKQSAPVDEDSRVAQCIEEYATRSDVVFGFAEVKYKQLVPLAPSMEHGLGGAPADKIVEEEDGLTVEAVVALSEEALVLYVKALALLAKCMDIASLWWSRKTRSEQSSAISSVREPSSNHALRINAAVQWVRGRFNEVLEKAEISRLKLIDAQKQLPEDHPSHPSNHPNEPAATSGSGADGIFLTAGISAEKLMYDRALEMSRTAAINEITNDDLQGCEISYITAVRMLEAVLDNDDDIPKRRRSGAAVLREREEGSPEINSDDQQAVQKVIHMITARLATVRKKMHVIAHASKAQQQQQITSRQRSGEGTPRSVPSHASS